MENKLQVFTNEQFGEVRITMINNEPWFVGKDVADVLGYINTRKAIGDHVDEDDKTDGVTIRDSIGRKQNPVCINESGLYSLIFSSKLLKAKEFKHWVTSEVLPQIRKTGGYIPIKPSDDYESVIKRNNEVLEQTFVMMQQLKPKVELYDTFLASPTETSFKDYADTFGCGRNKLMNFLRDCNVLGKKNTDEGRVPFGRFVSNGCFIVRLTPCADGVFRRTTYITPKGIDYIHKLCKKYHFNTEVA